MATPKPDEKPPVEKPKGKTKKVPFRPPIEKTTDKLSGGVVICENNRATVYDLNASDEGSQHFARQGNQLVRKPGPEHAGETVEEVRRSDSRVAREISSFNSAKTYLQFAVFPDSYEVFRAAREAAWQGRFDVRWIPLPAGQPLEMGGGGRARVQ
jgi:hypothetical protein